MIDFGAIAAEQKKRVVLKDHDINSPIQLVSIYAFASNGSSDQTWLRFFSNDNLINQIWLTGNDMPFAFPPGLIILPDKTIEVEPRFDASNLTIYWRPVHILRHVTI